MNEENKLPCDDVTEENNEIKTEAKKTLPLGLIIGISAGAVALIVGIILLVVLLGGGGDEACDGHVDANDDYLCDKCGENFDDGDEVVNPGINNNEITFKVVFDDGSPVAGLRFTLVRGGRTIELVSGEDGSVKAEVPAGLYSLEYDYETLPEYCNGEMFGVDISEGLKEVSIVITDNRPDGSQNKPYPTSDNLINLTVPAGEEIYFSFRGAATRYLTINNPILQVVYNGETYSAEDGVIVVPISSVDVHTPSFFAVKNPSDADINTDIEILYPEGSYENPIKITDGSFGVEVSEDRAVNYSYKAQSEGILVVATSTVGGALRITRSIVGTRDDGSEEILRTIIYDIVGGSEAYVYVTDSDKIIIEAYYDTSDGNADTENIANRNTELVKIDFECKLYAATESDPAPIMSSGVEIKIDSGATVVLSAESGKTYSVVSEDLLKLSLGGSEVALGSDITLTESGLLTVTNDTDDLGIFIIYIK